MLIFSLTAIICLLFSNLFAYVNLMVQGQEREISLFETVQVLFELKEWALSAFMLVVIIGLLAFFSMLISWLAIAIKRITQHIFWISKTMFAFAQTTLPERRQHPLFHQSER